MSKTRLSAALGLFALLASPAAAEPVMVHHAQGETRIDTVPERVVVTDWAAFDNLQALGVPVAGVPGSALPPYLADLVPADAPRVGSLQEPDIEGIAAAEPDLVIVASRSRTAYPTLSQLAPTIDATIDNADIVSGVKENLAKYGSLFGREARAGELAAALDAKVAEAREAARGKGTGLVVVTNGGRLGVYGPGSRVAWIYDALGIPSVFGTVDDANHGGDAVSAEYLLETNPDWLFVVDRDAGIGHAGAARATLDNELIRRTTFWQRNQIVYLDPAAAYVTMHGVTGLMLLLDQVIAGYRGAA
ncbi:siderophore ABC transporter substrate-binding protein [Aureimonas sp. ME7]|uniref:siderophore ABC transporter substrate-binding protein n=1 Tax=Aureimonas sp. ME7 TaxID=2744252 RepID=UPI0015F51260|nr:siderophore ABC transporter substrate-binding protein [Aureimonas sp. ME7]